MSEKSLPQANPTLDKMAKRLGLAGAGRLGPILKGLAGRIEIEYGSNEELLFVVIENEDQSFTKTLAGTTTTLSDGRFRWSTDIVFGTDTDSNVSGARNYLRWSVRVYGLDTDDDPHDEVFIRQFWVKDPPTEKGIYIANQEAQSGEAVVFINASDPNRYARDATFGINILPEFSDEFFLQHEYDGNRYAQTLRNWGGAATVEIFADGGTDPIIPEQDIADLAGYYWETPSYGLHTLTIRLRASEGSSHYVDLTAKVRFRQYPCPGV